MKREVIDQKIKELEEIDAQKLRSMRMESMSEKRSGESAIRLVEIAGSLVISASMISILLGQINEAFYGKSLITITILVYIPIIVKAYKGFKKRKKADWDLFMIETALDLQSRSSRQQGLRRRIGKMNRENG